MNLTKLWVLLKSVFTLLGFSLCVLSQVLVQDFKCFLMWQKKSKLQPLWKPVHHRNILWWILIKAKLAHLQMTIIKIDELQRGSCGAQFPVVRLYYRQPNHRDSAIQNIVIKVILFVIYTQLIKGVLVIRYNMNMYKFILF